MFNETMPIFLETIDEFSDVATAQQQHGLIEQLNDQVNILFPDHPHFSINSIIVFLTITLLYFPDHIVIFLDRFSKRGTRQNNAGQPHTDPTDPTASAGTIRG